jgi:hypothetical protein
VKGKVRVKGAAAEGKKKCTKEVKGASNEREQ